MLLGEFEERETPVREAEENLRVIRGFMERSTRYSTFSGLSGVFAGLAAIIGCITQELVVRPLPSSAYPMGFLVNWAWVVFVAIAVDFALTKRRAPQVGKTILSRLGKQMATAALPGLLTGTLLTLYFALRIGAPEAVYPFWMLCYGAAVSAVGMFSQREVGRLGWAFLGAGALTLVLLSPPIASLTTAPLGLAMVAISFGGFHIAYGISVSRRQGW